MLREIWCERAKEMESIETMEKQNQKEAKHNGFDKKEY